MPTQVSLLDGALASAGTLAIQTNGTTSAITISSAQVATFVNNPIMTGLTASRAVFTDGSKGLTSNAITGTGNVVMSASPTLTGTIDGAALTLSSSLTLSGGTANGVLYLNGSKVATSGSALTFDGTNLGVGVTPGVPLDIGGAIRSKISGGSPIYYFNDATYQLDIKQSGNALVFDLNGGSEGMRLTSTGLGIGTSSPSYKLQVAGTSGTVGIGVTGTIASGDNALYIAPSSVTGSYNFISGSVSATGTAGTSLSNTNNSNGAAHSRLDLGVGGASGGDPKLTYTVSGVLNWSVGVDNSDSDKFKISGSDSPGSSDYLTIDTSGNLGIGTSSPSYKLDVTRGASSGVVARLGRDSGAAAFIYADSSQIYYGAAAGVPNCLLINEGSNYLTLNTNGSERARIDSSGNFLLGKTSTSNTATGVTFGTVGDGYMVRANNGEYWRFYSPSGTQIGYILNNGGTSTTYSTSSDYRLKENIQPMTGALDKVAQLKPVTYTWKSNGSASQGFIAHELQAVVPECVTGEKDAVDAEGNPVYQGIDTSFLVATLTAALQEAVAEINSLKARLDAANL